MQTSSDTERMGEGVITISRDSGGQSINVLGSLQLCVILDRTIPETGL